MQLFEIVVDIILVMMLIGMFNFIRGILRVRKILKKYKDDPNVEGITIVNGEVKVIRKDQAVEALKKEMAQRQMVTDEICHKQIQKDKAYRVVKDGTEHFFCSWECREKFLSQEHEQ